MDYIKDVNLAIQGDEAAMERLYYNTYPKLRAVTMSILKNESDAEDIIQDTYIKAFSSLNQLDNASKFEAWLCRIASNKCKDYLKKHKPVLFSEFDNNEDDEPFEWSIKDDSSEYNPEEIAISDDTRRQLMELLDTLPDEQRICLVYYAVDEMKISEIAELLEVSENTIKSRLRYAEAKMKDKIEALEKKGVKIRSLSGFVLVPFLQYIFAQEASAASISTASFLNISSAVASSNHTASRATMESAKVVINEVAKNAGTKATVGLAAKIASMPLVTKIVACVVVIGIAVAVPVAIHQADSNKIEDDLAQTTAVDVQGSNNVDLVEPVEITYDISFSDLTQLNEYISSISRVSLNYPCSSKEIYSFIFDYASRELYELNFTKYGDGKEFVSYNEHFEYGCEYLEQSDIDDLSIKMFGKRFEAEPFNDDVIVYDGNVICTPLASGATYPEMSIVSKIYDNKDGTYRIEFELYEIDYSLMYDGVVPNNLYETTNIGAITSPLFTWMSSGYIVFEKDKKGNFYIIECSTNYDNAVSPMSKYKEMLVAGKTSSDFEFSYYAFLDLNQDDVPELLVSDYDGTSDSWSSCEIYTCKNNDLQYCGETNSQYDYFYLINGEYVLGKHRMGHQFIGVDKVIKTSYGGYSANIGPEISYNDGEWEFITEEEFDFYNAWYSDTSPKNKFIKLARRIDLKPNGFAK